MPDFASCRHQTVEIITHSPVWGSPFQKMHRQWVAIRVEISIQYLLGRELHEVGKGRKLNSMWKGGSHAHVQREPVRLDKARFNRASMGILHAHLFGTPP